MNPLVFLYNTAISVQQSCLAGHSFYTINISNSWLEYQQKIYHRDPNRFDKDV